MQFPQTIHTALTVFVLQAVVAQSPSLHVWPCRRTPTAAGEERGQGVGQEQFLPSGISLSCDVPEVGSRHQLKAAPALGEDDRPNELPAEL